MRNPFRRRKCCEVPLVAGDLHTPGATVTGLAYVDGMCIDFTGVVMADEVDLSPMEVTP